MPEELLQAVSERFRALSVPSRLRVLNALMESPLLLAELEEVTGLEQSNLSRHVTELERAGCVRRSRRGRFVEVELCDPSITALCDLVCGSLEERADERSRAFRAT